MTGAGPSRQVCGVAAALLLAGCAVLIGWILLNRTVVGPYIRSIGADAEGARRVGVPTRAVT